MDVQDIVIVMTANTAAMMTHKGILFILKKKRNKNM